MPQWRLFLDENSCSHHLATPLRTHGHHVVTIPSRKLGQSDRHLMEFRIEEMSTVITKNREHFEVLHRSVVPESPEDVFHAGIIIAPNVPTPVLEVALVSFLEATDPNTLIS